MNTTGWVWALVAVIIIAGGAWWYVSSNNNSAAPATSTTDNSGSLTGTVATTTGNDQGQPDTGVQASVTVTTPKTVTVTYNGSAFSPSTITVNKGDTVKFVDTDQRGAGTAGTMWVASDPHPTHTGYDGTSRTTHCAAGYSGPAPLDQCSTGSTFSFTFTKVGTFGYHNHDSSSDMGTVVVQ